MSDLAQGYDLIIALGENAINQQLNELWTQGIIDQNWDFDVQVDGRTIHIQATLGPPQVSFEVQNPSYYDVVLILSLQSGKLTFGDIYANINNWKFAFKADMQLAIIPMSEVNQSRIPNQTKQAIQQQVDLNQLVNIRHLFMDFENANLADYDQEKSSFDLSNGNIPQGNLGDCVNQFINLLSSHFQSLKGTNNPYILGYALDNPAHPSGGSSGAPTYIPTDATFSTTPASNGTGALNFLFMIEGHSLPTDNQAHVFNQSWISNPDQYGQFVVAQHLYWSGFLQSLASPFGRSASDFGQGGSRFVIDRASVHTSNDLDGGKISIVVDLGRRDAGTITVSYRYTMTKKVKILWFIPAGNRTLIATWDTTFTFTVTPDGKVSASAQSSSVNRRFDDDKKWWSYLLDLFPVAGISEAIDWIVKLNSFPNVSANTWNVAQIKATVVLPSGNAFNFVNVAFTEEGDLLTPLKRSDST